MITFICIILGFSALWVLIAVLKLSAKMRERATDFLQIHRRHIATLADLRRQYGADEGFQVLKGFILEHTEPSIAVVLLDALADEEEGITVDLFRMQQLLSNRDREFGITRI